MNEPPARVFGVDFAASKQDAGRDIWIAEGASIDDGLSIEGLAPAVDVLDGEPTSRKATLAGLSDFIAKQEDAAFGLDFPFGVASNLAETADWVDFVTHFPDSLTVAVDEDGDRPAKQLYDAVKAEVGDPKVVGVRESVEEEVEQGLSPTDWRMKELTFYGIRDVLQPLVEEAGNDSNPESDPVAVVPMESTESASVVVFETYPSAVFSELGAESDGYKGRREKHMQARQSNVAELEAAGVHFAEDDARVKARAYDDALDAVAACYATHKNVASGADFDSKAECFGEIYV